MVLVQQENKFCSDCVFAKDTVFEEGIRIYCSRPIEIRNKSTNKYTRGFDVYRKPNVLACRYFKKK